MAFNIIFTNHSLNRFYFRLSKISADFLLISRAILYIKYHSFCIILFIKFKDVTGSNHTNIPIRIPRIVIPIHHARTNITNPIRTVATFNHRSIIYFLTLNLTFYQHLPIRLLQ